MTKIYNTEFEIVAIIKITLNETYMMYMNLTFGGENGHRNNLVETFNIVLDDNYASAKVAIFAPVKGAYFEKKIR